MLYLGLLQNRKWLARISIVALLLLLSPLNINAASATQTNTIQTYSVIASWPQTLHVAQPSDLAVDTSGNLYVVDTGNNRIQEFNASGVFVATWGTFGTGDGQLSNPKGIAIDRSGNIYVVDSGNSRVQKFTPDGHFLAKWGGYGEDKGQFRSPARIAIDASGDVYVVDSGNHRIQEFTSDGTFIKAWGSGPGHGIWDFNNPQDIAVDSRGYIYVADTLNNRVQIFTPTGGFRGTWDGSGQTDAPRFSSPSGIAVDASDNVYVVDWSDSGRSVRKFATDGSIDSHWGYTGSQNGQFSYPGGIAIAPSGNIYIADTRNNRVQEFTADGTFLNKWGSQNAADGAFNSPQGVAADSKGFMYIADTENDRVQKLTTDGTFVTSWGTEETGNAQLDKPSGVALGPEGNIYVLDRTYMRIFAPNGTYISRWGASGWNTGVQTQPSGIAVDSLGFVYIADIYNHQVLKFTPDGRLVASWGKDGIGSTYKDGAFSPAGIAADTFGNIYVADSGYDTVFKYKSDGSFVASWGSFGSDDGTFSRPCGVTVDTSGDVYVADTGNHRIQKYAPKERTQFKDVPQSAWYTSYVNELAAQNIISGYTDNTFLPNNFVTRAEFAKIIVSAMGEVPSPSGPSFADIADSFWGKGYIERAKELGIIGGYSDGTFRPLANVTREEVTAIAIKAGRFSPETLYINIFPDVTSSSWSWPYILEARNLNLVSGYLDGTFHPSSPVTRAEASRIVDLLLKARGDLL